VTDLPRVIALEHIHNLRDLGGYPTADGRRTRWRTLFRADGLHRLSGDDLEDVRALGLRTVVDLRSDRELAERGRFPVAEHPVSYHHVSLIDVTWDQEEATGLELDVAGFLLEKYLEILESGEHRLAELFQVLALPEALPAVFHCAAGKDRTGIVAALVLSALGVADDVVVADYALTGEAMVRMRRWAEATSPEMAEAFRTQPAAHLAAAPGAMAGVLGVLRDVHGSTRDYLRNVGVSNAVLFDLEDALLG